MRRFAGSSSLSSSRSSTPRASNRRKSTGGSIRSDREPAFAVWLTGLPASGKSTVARALAAELARKGIRAAVLESDAVRREITPNAGFGEAERDAFYATLSYLARMLALHGVPVIVDATANRRAYRDRARAAIPRFLEAYVRCPIAVCQARDPKGIYRRGAAGTARDVPGVSAPYEPPLTPEVVVDGERDDPVVAARRIVSALEKKGFLPRPGIGGERHEVEDDEAAPASAASYLKMSQQRRRPDMANGENRVISHIRAQMKSAHWLLEETISDVSDEMGRFALPGKALPIGAAYVHYVTGEDWTVHSLFKGAAPLMAGPWAGRTGVSEPPPEPGDDYAARFEAWSRRVRVDLPAFRTYAKAIYEATDAFLASLTDAELSREVDLSAMGMGKQTVGFILDNAMLGHAHCHCGEISAMKGIQGKKGYPF